MIQTSAHAYQRDRRIVIAGIVVISLLSWIYLFFIAAPGSADPAGHTHHASTHTGLHAPMAAWDGGLLALSFVMWSVMMIAMMLPTATPMVLSFTRLQHKREAKSKAIRLTGWFSAGYLGIWVFFSVLAAFAQWALYSSNLMTSTMGSAEPMLAGALLVAAGLFQWSSLKEACLTQCRSPLDFLLNEWRPGASGAFIMGLRHGVFCVGCCWVLMLLMFVGGVMNLTWMAAITIYVLLEKILPTVRVFASVTGFFLMVLGGLNLAAGLWP
jgi:predicted metal-binding membrane protein